MLKAVKDYTRPPLNVSKERYGGEEIFKRLGINSVTFEKRRGNQAVYVCPFCDHLSDADIQAAMWIALKGWLRLHLKPENKNSFFFNDSKTKEIQKNWDGRDLNYIMQYAKKKNIPPIEFNPEKY